MALPKNANQAPLSPTTSANNWTTVIKAKTGLFTIDLRELWHYRDLVKIFFYRDLVVYYKQTILGPLWFLIKPLLTTITYTIVFNRIAKIPTDSIPPLLFYMAGSITWGYFSSCCTGTSNTFISNASIFGKVYFPRLIVPLSTVLSTIVQFGIQFAMFMMFWVYYLFIFKSAINVTAAVFLVPMLIVQMAILGMGFGMIITSLTTKYRDLNFLIDFGMQLWMYATPVVYPLSQIPTAWQGLYALNPMVAVIELFRLAFLGTSALQPWHYGISIGVTICIFLLGLVIFTKAERSFMDTV